MNKIISDAMDFAVRVTNIYGRDARYDKDAYSFLMNALNYTMSKLKKRRHISGREFAEGIREYSMRQYGPMTRMVFEHWGIKSTSDFGEMVFNLIEEGLMRKRPEDTKEDFRDIYDFDSAFDKPYRNSISPKIIKRKRFEEK